MNEPVFLNADDILFLHETAIEQYGGSHGVRETDLIESAAASAMNVYYYTECDLFDIASAYAFHISECQAFVDGSKRTAVKAALLYLKGNGLKANFDQERLYDLVMDIANHRLGKAGFAEALREMAAKQ